MPAMLALMAAFLFHPLIATEEMPKLEIIKLNVKGVGEAAGKIEELSRPYESRAVGMIFDQHGVLSRYSEPTEGPDLPRGDMPDYVRYRIECDNAVTIACAWNDADMIFRQLRHFELSEALGLTGHVERGKLQIGAYECEYYKSGKVASFKRLRPQKEPPLFYFQKAYSPLAVYGLECSFEILFLIEDSESNINLFQKDILQAPYYSKLKKLVLIKLPQIKGEDLPQDRIAPAFLPAKFRTRPYSREENTSPNPLLQSGFVLRTASQESLDALEEAALLKKKGVRETNPLRHSGRHSFKDQEDDADEGISSAGSYFSFSEPSEEGTFPVSSRRAPPPLTPHNEGGSLNLSYGSEHSIFLKKSSESCREEAGSSEVTSKDNRLAKSH
ncbi:MAG: hypothetical protein FJX71_04995 [Alphaproteobacteria bacterium]|nr:hypothetical protein [Alphaproteobacteria bacterium]